VLTAGPTAETATPGRSRTLKIIGVVVIIVLIATAAVAVVVRYGSAAASSTANNTATTTGSANTIPSVPVSIVNGSINVDYADCTPHSSGALNSPPSGTLNETSTTQLKRTVTTTSTLTITATINGTALTWTEDELNTTTINGTTYWYVTIVPGSSMGYQSWIMFHGVNFSIGQQAGQVLGNKATRGTQWTIIDATVLTGRTDGGVSCSYLLPSIGITFPDGSSADYNGAVIAVSSPPTTKENATGVITFDGPSSNPWFTPHLGPQAGVSYQAYGGEITLYVSVS